jgi:hypothetical protein
MAASRLSSPGWTHPARGAIRDGVSARTAGMSKAHICVISGAAGSISGATFSTLIRHFDQVIARRRRFGPNRFRR